MSPSSTTPRTLSLGSSAVAVETCKTTTAADRPQPLFGPFARGSWYDEHQVIVRTQQRRLFGDDAASVADHEYQRCIRGQVELPHLDAMQTGTDRNVHGEE